MFKGKKKKPVFTARWIQFLWLGFAISLWAVCDARASESLHDIFQDLPTAESEQDVWDLLSAGPTIEPKAISKKSEYREFEGYFVPTTRDSRLWVLADEGVDVLVVDYGLDPVRYGSIWPGERFKRHAPPLEGRLSLREVRYPFRKGEAYRLRIEYANMVVGDGGGAEGVSLIATNGGARVVGTLTLEVESETTSVGAAVQVTASLRNLDGSPALSEQVLFTADREPVATATTLSDGTATLRFTPVTPGVVRISAASLSGGYGFLKSKLITAVGQEPLATESAPNGVDAARLLEILKALPAEIALPRNKDTVSSAGWAARLAMIDYLRGKNGGDVEMIGVPERELDSGLWIKYAEEYRNTQSNQDPLYRLLTSHLKLASHLLAQSDSARRRVGLGIAYRAAGCAAAGLGDRALAVAICDGLLLPQLDAADVDPSGELSEKLILTAAAEMYRAAGQDERHAMLLQHLRQAAPNAPAAEAAERKGDACCGKQ